MTSTFGAGVGNTGLGHNARPVVSLRREETRRRQDEALRLRQTGMSYADIAVAVGFTVNQYTTGRETARRAVMAALARQTKRGSFWRTFGVELETQGLSVPAAARITAQALNLNHVHSAHYHGRTCNECGADISRLKGQEWIVESDSSIGSYHSAAEVVSPALSGDAGLAEVTAVALALTAAGARVSRSCGMHVHVGASDLSGQALARLVEQYASRQDVINSVLPVSRRNSRYAAPFMRYEIDRITDEAATGSPAANVAAAAGSRYKSVNLTNFNRTGTAEFRQHSGTLDPAKIAAWVRLCVALVDAAEQAVDIDTAADITEMTQHLAQQGLLDSTAGTYLTRRAAQIARR